jgi:hypothetical protein
VKVGASIALMAARARSAGRARRAPARRSRQPPRCRRRNRAPTPHQMETAARDLVADVRDP